MRQLELNIYNKLHRDFQREISAIESGMDILVRYSELLKDQTPYNKPSHTLDELLKASPADRCLTTQIMLVINAIETMKASRLLLLTGYIGPAMSCLRTSYESFENAHICSVLDQQALRFLNGRVIDKKVEIPKPTQLTDETAKEIKRALSNVGVHPSYKSLENQGYFAASLFSEEHRISYEFYFFRSLWSFLTIELYLLAYLVEKCPRLIREIPNVVEVATELRKMVDYTQDEFMKRAKE